MNTLRQYITLLESTADTPMTESSEGRPYEQWAEGYENRQMVLRAVHPDGSVTAPTCLYRVMSKAEFDAAKRSGAFRARPGERIHAANRPMRQYRYSPDTVVVRLAYAEADGWRPKWGDQLYAVSDGPIPFERATVMDGSVLDETVNSVASKAICEEIVSLDTGASVRVTRDPSPQVLLSMLGRAKHGVLRGLAHGRSVYWWDADDAIHGQIAAAMGIDGYVDDRLACRRDADGYAHPVWIDDEWRKHPNHPQFRRYMQSPKFVFDAGSHGDLIGPDYVDWLRDEGALTESGLDQQAGQGDASDFEAWFRGSKVVDKQGQPLVVHHGTAADFETFDLGAAPLNRANATLGTVDIEGLYFTADPRTAHSYAAASRRKAGGGKMRVINAFLRMLYPLDITNAIRTGQRAGLTFGDAKRKALTKLDRSKHDGVIFRGNGMNSAEYIVFSPDQVRPV